MNNITIELCAEDRARLDRLAEALERRTCDKCVAQAMAFVKSAENPDPVQAKLAETLAKANNPTEAPKNATGAAKAEPLTTTPQEEEQPKAEEPTPTAPAKTVNHTDIRNLVVTLSNQGKKQEAVVIVREYAAKVSDVPEDKVAECYERLEKLLEG